MEMYTNGSSFVTSLTLQPPDSFRDVSFSSYLNKDEENMIRKLTNDRHCRKQSEEDGELGVFGAERYYKGEIEDEEDKNDHRFSDNKSKLYQQDGNNEEFQQFGHTFPVKLRIDQTYINTPSVRSSASNNSRTGLLLRTNPPPPSTQRGSKTKTKTKQFLASFACNCINRKSTQTNEKRLIKSKEIPNHQTRMLEFDQNTERSSSKSSYRQAEAISRNDYFSFPVLNPNDLNPNSNLSNSNRSNSDRSHSISHSNSKHANLAGKVVIDNNNGGLTLGRKLSLLNNWDDDVPTEEEAYIPSSVIYNNNSNIDSDSSSDLFEIESLSTIENESFITNRKSNYYAPSEVSVDWSVVTASAADFSVVSDYEEMMKTDGWRISGRNDSEEKKGNGLLSGCASYKAVRVAGDECKVGGGGRRRLPESMAVGSLFRGGMI